MQPCRSTVTSRRSGRTSCASPHSATSRRRARADLLGSRSRRPWAGRSRTSSAEAALELNAQLDAAHVEVRISGRDTELVLVREDGTVPEPVDEAFSARITLRLPESLKQRVESAAAREGASVNTWLVQALQRALEPRRSMSSRQPQPPHRLRPELKGVAMYPAHLLPDYCDKPERLLRPDRRPLPQSNEIRIPRQARGRPPGGLSMLEHTFHTPLPAALEVSIPSGDIDVETVDGEETSLVVTGDERLLELVEVRHDGGRVAVTVHDKNSSASRSPAPGSRSAGSSRQRRPAHRGPHAVRRVGEGQIGVGRYPARRAVRRARAQLCFRRSPPARRSRRRRDR